MGSSQAALEPPAGSASAASTPLSTSAPQATAQASTPTATTDAKASPSSAHVWGIDISGYQGNSTDFATLAAHNYHFAFVKATESTNYTSSYYESQWQAARNAGFLTGVYHFAEPHDSTGAAQATYFYQHGASLSGGTAGTLPPVLDIEAGNDGECSGMSAAQMISWISGFVTTLKNLTGVTPLIYTNPTWWADCTGNTSSLASKADLWIAYWVTGATSPTVLPGWSTWKFWQYSDDLASTGFAPANGDIDVFNGATLASLQNYAMYNRVAGSDRYATSAQAAESFDPGVATAFIASGTSDADALSGGAAAGKAGGPILLVKPTSIPSVVQNALTRLKPRNIVILGGTGVVSTSVLNSLKSYTAGTVTREAGDDRYGTSAAVATANFTSGVANAYVAGGLAWPDAITGSAAAAASATSGPMLLTETHSVPASVVAALKTLKPKTITVLGGNGVVSSGVRASLAKYATSGKVVALSGSDRYATAQKIATTEFSSGVSVAYVATGATYADALAGAPLAALTDSPIVLVRPTSVPAASASALSSLKPKKIVILGGYGAVSLAVQSSLNKYVQ